MFDLTLAIICLMAACVMPGRWLRALIISPAGMQPGKRKHDGERVKFYILGISILGNLGGGNMMHILGIGNVFFVLLFCIVYARWDL